MYRLVLRYFVSFVILYNLKKVFTKKYLRLLKDTKKKNDIKNTVQKLLLKTAAYLLVPREKLSISKG